MADHRRRRRGGPRPAQDSLLPPGYGPVDSDRPPPGPHASSAGGLDGPPTGPHASSGGRGTEPPTGPHVSSADRVNEPPTGPHAGLVAPGPGRSEEARIGSPEDWLDEAQTGSADGRFDEASSVGPAARFDDEVDTPAGAGRLGGVYISYLDEGEHGADGTAVATAVFVDEDGYAGDGSYIGPAVFVDEHGHADDGTYVALDLSTDEPPFGDQGGGPPYDGGQFEPVDELGRPRRRRRRNHPILGAFVIAMLLLILVAGAGILWAVHQANPGGAVGRQVVVTIKKGASTAAIGQELTRAKVIHGGGTLFRYYVRLEGDGPLYPGTYHLATNESYDRVITILETPPKTFSDTLVIPEGFTLTEIAARVASLPGLHYTARAFLALSRSGSVTSPFERPGVHNLEGLLYPATYKVVEGTTETALMSTLEGDFVREADAIGLKAAAAKLHMTPYQVITVASIIQGEAKFASDGPDTASVIYNRLKGGMTLGADSTLLYALRRADPNLNVSKVNFEQPSRYNTRLHKGLPPTPIDNPSSTFLKDAMNPPHTNLLYFVEIDKDGKLGFASTSAGFSRLTAECREHGLC